MTVTVNNFSNYVQKNKFFSASSFDKDKYRIRYSGPVSLVLWVVVMQLLKYSTEFFEKKIADNPDSESIVRWQFFRKCCFYCYRLMLIVFIIFLFYLAASIFNIKW